MNEMNKGMNIDYTIGMAMMEEIALIVVTKRYSVPLFLFFYSTDGEERKTVHTTQTSTFSISVIYAVQFYFIFFCSL